MPTIESMDGQWVQAKLELQGEQARIQIGDYVGELKHPSIARDKSESTISFAFGELAVRELRLIRSRRIDNQLRGRSGRQGDPGRSRFFVSLDDDIMRIFGGDSIAGLMDRFKMPEDVPLEHSIVTKQ